MQDFYHLIEAIKNLIYLKDEKDIETIKSLIEFKFSSSRLIYLLKDLYAQINSTKIYSEQIQYVQEYLDSTYSFQNYLVREDTNNFNNYLQTLDGNGNIIESTKLIKEPIEYFYCYYNYETDENTNNFWSKDLEIHPHLLTFWFDFLNPEDSEIAKYSVPAIGTRAKAIKNDTNIPAIHYKDIPDVIFQNAKDKELYEHQDMYLYVTINEASQSLFKKYSKGKSAKEYIDDLLYQHSYCTQNVTIQNIPVYHLQPNNRVCRVKRV